MRAARCGIAVLMCVVAVNLVSTAQQAAAGTTLSISTPDLRPAEVSHSYKVVLQATGGITPLRWEISGGTPPPGLVFGVDGVLSGIPAETGEFHFTVTVSDADKPAHQIGREYTLRVIAPLTAQWGKPPRVNGRRLEGSIIVSNATDHDFDVTMIALAVNDIGRATAIGYQRLKVAAGATGTELPFGENLPSGSYQLNVDVTAEVAATQAIYRARLVPDQRIQITQGP